MKKIMILVAAAAIMMSCGGNAKKAESVVDQNKAWAEKIANAKDEEEAKKLVKEYEEWYNKLSDEDKKAIEEAAKAEAAKLEEEAKKAAEGQVAM